jgi:hypothetical protein
LLGVVDDHDTPGPRLLDDGSRLWRRLKGFLAAGLIDPAVDYDPLELACYALQLPHRFRKDLPKGTLGQMGLKERAHQAGELLVTHLVGEVDVDVLDRTIRLLQELPQRAPMLDDARLLADAVNLDDFGVTGLLVQAIQLGRRGDGVAQVAEGCEKREQYGYWDVRLRDGFHFEPVRAIARRRLEHARAACRMLGDELNEDGP